MNAPVVKPRRSTCSACGFDHLVIRLDLGSHQFDFCKTCATAIVTAWAQASRALPDTVK